MIYANVLQHPDDFNFGIESLGECIYKSPVKGRQFVDDDEQISFVSQMKNIQLLLKTAKRFPAFQKAGPRKKIFHDTVKTKAAIVTCGGLCPGLNNVIKGLVNVLYYDYGIRDILGVRYGYQGLVPEYHHYSVALTPEIVDEIHRHGGTMLGSSRGNQDISIMVDTLQNLNINLLFCIGGDGTLRGSREIFREISLRKLPVGVIGIPKTIDNDLSFIEKTFGFETAVESAIEVITSAHNEAEGAENGIGIVKLMGRDSGFIAAAATLANSVVDFCLIPEVDFSLEDDRGLCAALERKLDKNRHAVIVAAEGAGQSHFSGEKAKKDASGNILKHDVGLFLKEEISGYFSRKKRNVSIKYLDPSYHIRSIAAISSDAIFCYLLAEHAVHAGMAGKTDMVIGHWNNYFTHVPIDLAVYERRKVDLDGALWKGVLSATRQNDYLGA